MNDDEGNIMTNRSRFIAREEGLIDGRQGRLVALTEAAKLNPVTVEDLLTAAKKIEQYLASGTVLDTLPETPQVAPGGTIAAGQEA